MMEYKIDFQNEVEITIDGKKTKVLRFYEMSKPGLGNITSMTEYAYISQSGDIVFKNSDGDITTYPKEHLNEFVFNIYNNINDKISDIPLMNKSKNSKPFYEMRILGQNFPLAIYLLINDDNSDNAFAEMNLDFQFNTKKDNSAAVNLSFKDINDVRHYLSLYPKDESAKYYANGLNQFNLKNSVFEPNIKNYKQALLDIILYKKGARFAKNIITVGYKFIDGSTKKILQDAGQSTELHRLFSKEMVDLLGQRLTKSQYDLDNYRLRMSETITSIAYNQMLQAVGQFKSRKHLSNEKIVMVNDYIINNLKDAGILQYTKTLNPLEEMMLSLKVTKTGIGNVRKQDVTLNRRDTNPSYFGIIAPTATNEYGGIGINQTLTNSASIDDRYGSLSKRKFSNDSNSFGNLSPVESLTPFFEYDDTTRRVMGNQQTGQFVQLKNPDLPLVQTGFEAYAPHLVSDRFAKKAKEDGVIQSITSELIKVKYKSGKTETFPITAIKSRTKRGIYIANEYNVLVSKGQKVQEGDVLAASDSLKTGKLAIGKNLVVAEMGYLGLNYEDGWVVSDTLTEKYNNKILQKINILLPSGSNLKELNIQLGKDTKAGETLIKFNTSEDFIEDDIDEETESIMVGLVTDGLTKSYLSPGGVIKEVVIKLNSKKVSKEIMKLYNNSIETIKQKKNVCSEFKEGTEEFANCIGHLENSESLTIGGHKFNGEEVDGTIIEVYIEQVNPVRNGSKFTMASSGGKGTVQYIMAHGQEPIAEETGLKIEFIGTPISIISRKNPSILLNMYLGKVIYFLNLTCIELAKAKKVLHIKKLVTEVFTHLDQTEDLFILDQLETFFKLNHTQIIKIVNGSDALNNPAFPAIVPPFKNKLKIKHIKLAAKVLDIPLNEKVRIIENNGIVTTREVPVGILPIPMLEHFPKAMAGIRGSLNTKKSWITGQGRSGTKEGNGATQVGLYDIKSLLSKRPYQLIKELHAIKSDASHAKQQMIKSITRNNAIPSIDDIEIEKSDLTSLNMVEIYFKGAGLQTDI